MAIHSSNLVKVLTIGLGLFVLASCMRAKESALSPPKNENSIQINLLTKRIEELELKLGKRDLKTDPKENKAPKGPIKSLTFRLGTKDDRLRIYWADGSNSDLPCTKEQSIWVCG